MSEPITPPVVPPVNPETPPVVPSTPESGWQNPLIPNDVPVAPTEVTPTPADTKSELDAIFDELLKDDAPKTPEVPATPASPEAPKTPETPVPVDGEKVKELEAKVAASEEAVKFQETNKNIINTIEGNETLKKFINAIVSGKITFEGVFEKYAANQLTKTPKPGTVPSSGSAPTGERSLQDRLAGAAGYMQRGGN